MLGFAFGSHQLLFVICC